MSEEAVDPDIGSVLARLDSAIDELIALPLDGLSDDDLLALLRGFEAEKRRLSAVSDRLIGP